MRIEPPERAPHQQMRVRGGAQTEERDGAMRVAGRFSAGLPFSYKGPTFVDNKSLPQQTKHIITAAVAIVFLGASAFMLLSGDSEPASRPVVSAPVQQAPKIEMVFDVPSLLGKNLSQLTAALGTPDENSEPTATYRQLSDERTWDKAWHKDGYLLDATYNIDTGKVVDLFVGTYTDAALVTFRDTANILTVGNLTTTDPRYSVEFVKLKAVLGRPGATPEGYTGAIVTAK